MDPTEEATPVKRTRGRKRAVNLAENAGVESTQVPVKLTRGRQHAVKVLVEPSELAGWMGLKDATVLGTQPFEMRAKAVAALRQFGQRAELLAIDAAVILRVHKTAVGRFTRPGRDVVLGHRETLGGCILIAVADLVAFIEQKAKPPVPTTGRAPQADLAASRKAVADARKRHNLPAA